MVADVDAAVDELLHQTVLEPDPHPQCNVREPAAHHRQPVHQQVVPQAETGADGQRGPVAWRHADLVAGLFQIAHQLGGVFLKAPPGGREHRASLVAHEQLAAQIVLQGLRPQGPSPGAWFGSCSIPLR